MEIWANRVSSNSFHICWYYTRTPQKKCPIQNNLKLTGFQMNICIWRSICSWYKYNTLSLTANFHCCWHTSNTWNISESRDREKTSRETPPHPHSPMESHRYVTHSLALPRDTCCAICRLRAPRASLYNVKEVHCTLPSVILHSWWATNGTETPRLTQTI